MKQSFSTYLDTTSRNTISKVMDIYAPTDMVIKVTYIDSNNKRIEEVYVIKSTLPPNDIITMEWGSYVPVITDIQIISTNISTPILTFGFGTDSAGMIEGSFWQVFFNPQKQGSQNNLWIDVSYPDGETGSFGSYPVNTGKRGYYKRMMSNVTINTSGITFITPVETKSFDTKNTKEVVLNAGQYLKIPYKKVVNIKHENINYFPEMYNITLISGYTDASYRCYAVNAFNTKAKVYANGIGASSFIYIKAETVSLRLTFDESVPTIIISDSADLTGYTEFTYITVDANTSKTSVDNFTVKYTPFQVMKINDRLGWSVRNEIVDAQGYPMYLKKGGNSTVPVVRTTGEDAGFQYFQTTANRLIVADSLGQFREYDGVIYNTNRSGTFATKPTVSANGIYVNFTYFCTDRQTVEGALNGIQIIHKGSDIWVDSLGRVVS